MAMVQVQEESRARTKISRSWYSVGLVWALLLAGCRTARQVPSNLEDACNAGDAPSCFNLGVLFANGRGVGKDEARAAALYTKACEGGHTLGCYNLGRLFAEGRGVGKDEARAAALYTKACEGGEALGCFNLGLLFANGRGIGKDKARAAFARGCALGDQESCAEAQK